MSKNITIVLGKKTIEGSPQPYINNYTNDTLCFSFIAEPKPGSNERIVCTDWVVCRDFLNNIMRAHITKGSMTLYKYGQNEPLDFNKLRLLIKCRRAGSISEDAIKDIKNKIFSGKKIINLYEQIAGWKESKIRYFNTSSMKKTDLMWLLTGHKNWMRSSHMVSMITLIMRIAFKFGPLEIDDVTENNIEQKLNVLWQKIITTNGPDEYPKTKISFDIEYLKNCAPKFINLMRNNDKIFGNFNQRELFPQFHKNFHECGGINSLCTLKTEIKKLDDLCEEYLI